MSGYDSLTLGVGLLGLVAQQWVPKMHPFWRYVIASLGLTAIAYSGISYLEDATAMKLQQGPLIVIVVSLIGVAAGIFWHIHISRVQQAQMATPPPVSNNTPPSPQQSDHGLPTTQVLPSKRTAIFVGEGAKDTKIIDPFIVGAEVGIEIHGEGTDLRNPVIMQGSQTKQMRQWPELQKWSNAKLRSEIQSTVAELRKFEQKYRNQTASILATRFSGMNADQRKKISEENSAAVEKIYREEQQEFEEKINPKVQPLFEETVRRLELTQLPFEAGTIFRFGKYTGSEPVSKAADYLETLAKRLN